MFSDALVQVFDGIGGINDFSDFQRKIKITGKAVPVVAPGLNGRSCGSGAPHKAGLPYQGMSF